MKSRWQTLRAPARLGCLVPFCGLLALSGCVFGEESESPVLTVYLYWEYDGRSHHNGTCESVPVAVSEWRLHDSQGNLVYEVPREEGACDDQINFHDLKFDSYELEVIGYDEAGDKAWEGTCNFELYERFDRLTECSVYPIDS